MNAKQYRQAGLVTRVDFHSTIFRKLKDPKIIAAMIERAQSWTSGNLVLTRLIYEYIAQYSAQILYAEGADIVDEIVHQKIIKNWRNNDAAILLRHIEQALQSFEPQDTLLVLYLQILWRGGIATHTQPYLSAEQKHLLKSKLVTVKGNQLQVANRIYASIFDLSWIEQQRPGLTTRTVSVPPITDPIDKASTASTHISQSQNTPSSQAKDTPTKHKQAPLQTKLTHTLATGALFASGLALFGLAAASSFKGPNNLGTVAKPSATEEIEKSAQHSPTQPFKLSSESPQKYLFDQGLEHARNGRWLSMMHQFCSIPPTSAYFAAAESQLSHWIVLYTDNIQQANKTFLAKQNTPCVLVESAFDSIK